MNPIRKFLIQRKLKKLEAYEKKLEQIYEKQAAPKTSIHVKDDIKHIHKGFKGQFIQKDTSISFVVLVAVCVLIIVGLTIFYYEKFQDLNDVFQTKLGELNQAYETITKKEGELLENTARLVVTEAGKEDLESQYSDVRGQLNAEKEKNEDLQDTIAVLNDRIAKLEQENKKLQSDNAKLRKRIDDLESQ